MKMQDVTYGLLVKTLMLGMLLTFVPLQALATDGHLKVGEFVPSQAPPAADASQGAAAKVVPPTSAGTGAAGPVGVSAEEISAAVAAVQKAVKNGEHPLTAALEAVANMPEAAAEIAAVAAVMLKDMYLSEDNPDTVREAVRLIFVAKLAADTATIFPSDAAAIASAVAKAVPAAAPAIAAAVAKAVPAAAPAIASAVAKAVPDAAPAIASAVAVVVPDAAAAIASAVAVVVPDAAAVIASAVVAAVPESAAEIEAAVVAAVPAAAEAIAAAVQAAVPEPVVAEAVAETEEGEVFEKILNETVLDDTSIEDTQSASPN